MLGVPSRTATCSALVGRYLKMYELNPGRGAQDSVRASTEFSEYLPARARAAGEPGRDLISQLALPSTRASAGEAEELVAPCVLLLNAGQRPP